MVQIATVIEQPQQQRSDVRSGAVLVPPKAGHHAIRRSRVLDLQHRAFARLVSSVEWLGDNAVQPGALEPIEPVAREVHVPRSGRQVDRRLGVAQLALDRGAPVGLWRRAQVLVAEREQVPGDE